MSKLTNKIEANDRTIYQVLNEQKYTVDYFQREYSWGQKHIEQLVIDLTSSFLTEYTDGDGREKGEDYNNYYLGPFVVSEKEGKRSIIDGQQRLTSLTLFLIYLNHKQKEFEVNEKIEEMIFSEHRGSKSFNIEVEERTDCLEQLFNLGAYDSKESEDESTKNMAERYSDIAASFPDEAFNAESMPSFIDWVKYNVILVEIIAYSDDNAYTIFETMNDRGLNLTSTEMLKGFVLSRFTDDGLRQKSNELWKTSIQDLHAWDKNEDQRFFQAWLRAKYAESIRPGAAGSKNEDFEKIGTRFHSWVRENLSLMNLTADSQDDFITFINEDFIFYRDAYLKIRDAENEFIPSLEHVYYIQCWGIATSLSYPLLLASLNKSDSADLIDKKMNLVAKYIETFVVRRSINFKKFSASSIRYTMYMLVKEIRNKTLPELHVILSKKLDDMDKSWNGLDTFRLHGQNRRFTKFLLSRISAFIDKQSGRNETFETYYYSPQGKPFEVEHIWANKFEEHTDEFEQKGDFEEYRNRIGALVLLPRGSNQSYGAKPYEEKLPHYIKENLLVQTLCNLTYQNNPNFLSMKQKLGLPFEAHDTFNKDDIIKRQKLYREICERIWRFESPETMIGSQESTEAEDDS